MQSSEILSLQKTYFQSGKTLDINFRISNLKKLYNCIKKYEKEICDALKEDLGKSEYESYMCEIGLVLDELSYMIKHTPKFAKEKRVKTPLAQFPSRSYRKPTPFGNVLIMSPWNYPFLLTIDPLTDALAAGNTAIVKPSAYSPATSLIIKKIIEECFDVEYVAVVTGGRKENSELLDLKFDFVFFTGSTFVGKEVLRHTAENLTPVVLELGGKSPCIVDKSANIPLAARRIVFGKYLNCGQTCVAPDYIYVQKNIKEEFIEEVKKELIRQYGEEPLNNKDYGRIVNEKHFDRILGLISKDKLVMGGKSNRETLQIAPTILKDVTWDDAVMGEEIFGPIMPILDFNSYEEIYDTLKDRDKPLALYLFTSDTEKMKEVSERIRYGGGCMNDTVIHLSTTELAFGGVGESGMGSYHGKVGFDTFSHIKSIIDKKTWLDLPMRYQPYNRKLYKKLLHLFLK